MKYSRITIDLLKEYISKGIISKEVLNKSQIDLSTEIDSRRVNNKPTEEIEALYEDIMWLKCDILNL